ncbi:MAG: 50S ribosomal protein L25 [Polyangiaceae bacterium]|nr:50S ribosomal protein L25 [Polyangiaceae bacterium]
MDTTIAKLKAETRKDWGKSASRRLRRAGSIPAVAYGRGAETLSLAISPRDLTSILYSEHGRNSVIELDIAGGTPRTVMVKDFTVEPISRALLHADFVAVDVTKPLLVEVPFRTAGKSKGELEGGTLLTTTRTVPVLCLPADIPPAIVIDVTELEMENVLKVKDLTLPEGIKLELPADMRLVTVKAPKMEVEEPKPGEAVAAEGAAAAPAEGEAPKAEDAKGDKKPEKKDEKK